MTRLLPILLLSAASVQAVVPSYRFTATALARGLESLPSNEVTFMNTNRSKSVTLAWDRSTDPSVTNYIIYRRYGSLTNVFTVGNTNQATVTLALPVKTNRVFTFASSVTNWPSVSLTNPTAPRLFVRSEATAFQSALQSPHGAEVMAAATKWRVTAQQSTDLRNWSPWPQWRDWTNAAQPSVWLSAREVVW